MSRKKKLSLKKCSCCGEMVYWDNEVPVVCDSCFARQAKESPATANNKHMAEALWLELKRRQSNGRVPLRVDWVAVTEKRLNAAVAALRHA
jgi:hypothetical protein